LRESTAPIVRWRITHESPPAARHRCALVALTLVPARLRRGAITRAAPPPVIVPALPVAIEEKIDPALRALMQAIRWRCGP